MIPMKMQKSTRKLLDAVMGWWASGLDSRVDSIVLIWSVPVVVGFQGARRFWIICATFLMWAVMESVSTEESGLALADLGAVR